MKGDLEKLLKEVVIALLKASETHDLLGIKGEELVQKNQFGDAAVRADIEAEKAVLDHLKSIELPIRVFSEEHGVVSLNAQPIYLGLLDGIDGSAIYKKKRGTGRYSTMFGIFQGLNPKYKDYLVSGIIEHATKRLFIASQGKGAWLIKNNQNFPIRIRQAKPLNRKTKIYIDNYLEVEKKIYRDILIKKFPNSYNDTSGSSTNYLDVILGAYDAYIEYTKKQNLEKAIAYGLIKEAGGTMIDIGGKDIGERRYLKFGQNKETPVITANKRSLAKQILKEIIRKK